MIRKMLNSPEFVGLKLNPRDFWDWHEISGVELKKARRSHTRGALNLTQRKRRDGT
jgi:hypothetical protein